MMTVTYSGALAPAPTMRQKVEQLEASMLGLPQVHCPVAHFTAPGQIARRMEIPAGTVVTGAVHKVEHLIVIAKGRLRIVTEDGTREVAAGDVITCKPGMKNAVTALEDSTWVNVFATDETDPDRLVELVTEAKAEDLLGHPKNKQLAAQRTAAHVEK
jgi:quercetin dioxygenase-like cupin family protein